MESREDIFNELKKLMNELFELPEDEIKLESKFYDDLNLDSIDAIDLIGQLQAILGERVNPEDFKTVMTVGDVVQIIEQMVKRKQSSEAKQSL